MGPLLLLFRKEVLVGEEDAGGGGRRDRLFGRRHGKKKHIMFRGTDDETHAFIRIYPPLLLKSIAQATVAINCSPCPPYHPYLDLGDRSLKE